MEQVLDGLDMQRRRIGEDEVKAPGAEAFLLADAGPSQMTLDMQPGKTLFSKVRTPFFAIASL